ncbi:MAG: thiamine pyrophosphate-binding protein [Chloroflexi bacterium]|nr:thiamine pyrophosphate-binding protein [Chloroflexota bacterium]
MADTWLTAFTVSDFQDLLDLLKKHPDWRAALRQHILPDDLLEIPARRRRSAESQRRTDETLAALALRQDRLAAQLEAPTGRVDALNARTARATPVLWLDSGVNSEVTATAGVAARTGAHLLLEALARHGVDTLFGVPGHGAYPIYDALNDVAAIRPYVGRNEQGVTFAAEGFASATGRVAVATSVPRAGLTNAATAIWEANDMPSRLLFLLEADPSHRAILGPICRYHEIATSAEAIVPAVEGLLARLTRGRPGSAALEVPQAVLAGGVAAQPRAASGTATTHAIPASLPGIAEALVTAHRPLLIAGAPAADAPEALTHLAEALGAPVLVDGRGKGAIPDRHALALGMSWARLRPAEELVAAADVVLAIGATDAPIDVDEGSAIVAQRPTEWRARHLLQIDWDGARSGVTRGAAFGHVPTLLDALAGHIPPRRGDSGWEPGQMAAAREAFRRYAAETVPWALPLWHHLRASLPEETILCADSLVGLWTARLYPVDRPRSFLYPWGTGTLGRAVPAALGAARAYPHRPVVALMGDGAFMYNAQELATAALHGQKIVVLIANDDGYGAIKHNMTRMFGRSIAHELRNPDFVALGRAFGMRARRLATLDDLPTAIHDALDAPDSSIIELPLELRPPRF